MVHLACRCKPDRKGGIAMGLDIYAGTLTRYYSHNWKTVVQQWAEENGYTFQKITPQGEAAGDGNFGACFDASCYF